MYYNVRNLKDLINLDGEKLQHRTLLENTDKNSCIKLMALKKDELIDTHTSESNTFIYILDGEIELHFDAQKFELKKGDFMLFEKEKEHKVLAKKDSKFMLVIL